MIVFGDIKNMIHFFLDIYFAFEYIPITLNNFEYYSIKFGWY